MTKEALEAFNKIDGWISDLRNMINEDENIFIFNIPTVKADIDCAIKELRKHGANIRAALAPQPVEKIRIGGKLFDFDFIKDFDPRAKKNHCQSIRRLMERGGLSWREAYYILNDASFPSSGAKTEGYAKEFVEIKYKEYLSARGLIAAKPEPIEGLREGLKVAEIEEIKIKGSIFGAVICDDLDDANRIVQAARRYLDITGGLK